MTRQVTAVVLHAYGGNEVVTLADVKRPQPRTGEVMVEVRAAEVNSLDWKVRDGAGQRMGMTLRVRLGFEMNETAADLGAGVKGFAEGDAVFGTVGGGAFATYVVAKASELVGKSKWLDFVHAAAVPLGTPTAWQGMFEMADFGAGQKLLITGASGGVGSLAVQIAKNRGAHVTVSRGGDTRAKIVLQMS